MRDRHTAYKPDELPRSLTRKLYVHYQISGYGTGQISVYDWPREPDGERVVLCETEVTIDIPDINRDGLKRKQALLPISATCSRRQKAMVWT
jgi:hypothetical protein